MTAAARALPPVDEWVPRVFIRDDCFYILELPADDNLAEHARLNPGTRQITDMVGVVLWGLQ